MARILLADDEAASRDLTRRALEADGHAVETAADGAEALARLAHPGASFDVLVSDVQMPGLDGVALVEKAAALLPRLRFVMMSGFPDQLDRARRAGPAGTRTIAKPFAIDRLRAEVKAALAG